MLNDAEESPFCEEKGAVYCNVFPLDLGLLLQSLFLK